MSKELLQQALNVFLESREFYDLMQAYRHYQVAESSPFESVKSALRAAIAQPVQPAPVRVPLTDEQVMDISSTHNTGRAQGDFDFARAIEAHHGIGTTPQPAEGA